MARDIKNGQLKIIYFTQNQNGHAEYPLLKNMGLVLKWESRASDHKIQYNCFNFRGRDGVGRYTAVTNAFSRCIVRHSTFWFIIVKLTIFVYYRQSMFRVIVQTIFRNRKSIVFYSPLDELWLLLTVSKGVLLQAMQTYGCFK